MRSTSIYHSLTDLEKSILLILYAPSTFYRYNESIQTKEKLKAILFLTAREIHFKIYNNMPPNFSKESYKIINIDHEITDLLAYECIKKEDNNGFSLTNRGIIQAKMAWQANSTLKIKKITEITNKFNFLRESQIIGNI